MQTPVSKRKVCFRTRGNMFGRIFLSLSILPVPRFFYERSRAFLNFFPQGLEHFMRKGQSFNVFSFSKEGHAFDKEIFGQSSLYSLLQHNPLFFF